MRNARLKKTFLPPIYFQAGLSQLNKADMRNLFKNINPSYCLITVFIIQVLLAPEVNSQTGCDENKIQLAEDIRRTAENNLIFAVTVNVNLTSGIEITAFYTEGKLIKISTTDNLSHSEQLFFENGMIRVYERSGYNKGKEYFTAWYIESDQVFCKQDKLSGKFLTVEITESKKLINIVDEYLFALQ